MNRALPPHSVVQSDLMQYSALDTSEHFKFKQCVTRMMNCMKAVKGFHSVFLSAVGGGGDMGLGCREKLLACQLVFDSVQNHI